MKRFLLAVLVLLPLVALAGPYKVIFPAPEFPDGTVIYMYNLDTGEKIDSCRTEKSVAVFKGEIDDPVAAYMATDHPLNVKFVLEEGSFTFDSKKMPRGSMLNDILTEEYKAIAKAREENTGNTVPANLLITEAIERNADTPIGFILLRDFSSDFEPSELIRLLNANPVLKTYKTYNKHIRRIINKKGFF